MVPPGPDGPSKEVSTAPALPVTLGDVRTPTAIGPYPVLRAIASGGMSTVYEVADPATGTTYAAKVLDPRLLDDPRFEQEYVALARVNHPNIIRALRYGRTEEGAPYLVLELIFGVTAQVRVKSTGRPGDPARTAEAVRIAHAVASALAHMHARGLVHRDLKSNNVIVSADGQIKILDFGTVRLMKGGVPITRRGDFVGTFAYASPEQLTGQNTDQRSDLYSLGVLLYRLLTGKKPFDGENPEIIARQHLEYTPPPPIVVVPTVPEALSALVMRLIEKDPANRPAGARAVVDWLHPWLPRRDELQTAPARIGRGDQLAMVDAILDRAEAGRTVLFAGPPPAEPLHHLRRAADEAGRRGMRILRLDLAMQDLSTLRTTIADLQPSFPEIFGAATADEADEALAQAIGAQAARDGNAVVIAVSGAERVPGAVARRLFDLARRCREHNALALFFFTWGEEPLDPDVGTVIHVAPLSASELVEVARRRLGVDGIPPGRVQRLLALSGGRPSVLEDLLEVGGLEDEVPLPGAVEHTLAVEVGRLPRNERRVLEAITTADGLLDEARLVHAVDLTPAEVSLALSGLTARGFVDTVDGRARCTFGALAVVARQQTRRLRFRLYCRRIAERADDLPPDPRVARLLVDGGRADLATEVIVRWSAGALRLGQHHEVRMELGALADTGALPGSPEAWRLLAAAHAGDDGAIIDAERALARATELAATPEARADVALTAAGIARRKGMIELEIRKFNEAIRAFEAVGAKERVAGTRLALAETLRRIGELERAEQEARLAVASTRQSPVLAAILLDHGVLTEAESRFAAAYERDLTHPDGPWRAATGYVRTLRTLGKWSAAYTVLGETLPRARAEASARRLSRLLLAEAEIDIDLYRLGQARDALDEILAINGGRVPEHLVPSVGRVEARILHMVGEREEALRVADGALELAVHHSYGRAAAELRGLRAAIVAGRDGPDAWRREFNAARDTLHVFGAFPALSRICALWAEVTDGIDPADQVFRPVNGWIDREPCIPARLERALAYMRSARRRNEMIENRRLDAFLLLDQLREALAPQDAGALDVHPYAVELRRL